MTYCYSLVARCFSESSLPFMFIVNCCFMALTWHSFAKIITHALIMFMYALISKIWRSHGTLHNVSNWQVVFYYIANIKTLWPNTYLCVLNILQRRFSWTLSLLYLFFIDNRKWYIDWMITIFSSLRVGPWPLLFFDTLYRQIYQWKRITFRTR